MRFIMEKTSIFFVSIALAFLIILPGCSPEPEETAAEDTVRQDDPVPEETPDPELDSQSPGNEEVQDGGAKEDSSPETDLEKLAGMEGDFQAVNAFPGLSFQRPLGFHVPGDSSGRIFIVEQAGKILTIYPDGGSSLFLDIRDRVDDGGNEMGLLGLAFHPGFSENGLFYLNYTGPEGTVISEYNISSKDPEKADPESEEILLTFSQPYSNHNGGQLAFGPDGYLYIGTGDGGSAGDPGGNGQNRTTLLGNILRIDIDGNQDGLAYSIPGDNPFIGNDQGFRQEIFAYGLRNPWRFSFDTANGRLWAADVGQDQIEEIDIIEKGKNYGWNIMEGSQCYEPPSDCDTRGLVLPVYEYDHSRGSSVTGGYVYHGESLPMLEGIYVYADFVSGNIWGLAYTPQETARNFILAETGLNISSFGLDADGELYFTAFDGNIYQLSVE
jgi:glucose/arabinose dehydrogenase